ncbi:MAG TPA: enoyl-CoA hydratase/isomerase family protein [Smithellaceae bacterium]|nr:enoyl-CoA hydratase/isomerase family protein [Smithellaceae bacterium]
MNENLSARHVLSGRSKSVMSIVLNRPEAINSLSESMIDAIDRLLDEAAADPACRLVLFYSKSDKGFCAGGDVKQLARLSVEGNFAGVDSFFTKEYALDLKIHLFPKPVVVLADGITMGGGLGITAGADLRVATERTRMAMPETRIGFFPDVGSTGWMFSRCPKGYPEYLGLTGYDMRAGECVRLGFADVLTRSGDKSALIESLETFEPEAGLDKEALVKRLGGRISGFCLPDIPRDESMDRWVERYFAGRTDVRGILDELLHCTQQQAHCADVFASIGERSPTALVLTLALLRRNENRPISDVFAAELKASRFMSRHPDYVEGIRARLIDRDDNPKWNPPFLDQVDPTGFVF